MHLRAAQQRLGLESTEQSACDGIWKVLPLQEVILDFRHLGEHVNERQSQDAGRGNPGGQPVSGATMFCTRRGMKDTSRSSRSCWIGEPASAEVNGNSPINC